MTSAANEKDLIVGIDLGTTNSLIAVCDERGPRVIADAAGEALLPSVVRFGSDGAAVVGHEARKHAVEFPQRTISSVKRLMGRSFEDAMADQAHLSYAVVPGARGTAAVSVDGRAISPEQVSSLILAKLRDQAEAALKRSVAKAVITVPAYFDDAQRQATRDAGRLAGLDVVRIVNEPTAAALAYGIGTRLKKPEIIAVYDLGGGTFDISILQVTPPESGEEGGESFFQVLATAGDTHLGGDDVDHMLADILAADLRRELGADLPFSPATRQSMKMLAEGAKIRLSTEPTARVRVQEEGGRFIERDFRRDEFEALIRPWVQRTLASCEQALRDAKLSREQIDRVVLVGGSTRIPMVRAMVGEFFGREPYTALDPDQVVALGAAVQASILSGANRQMLLLDVIPLSLGIETVGGAVAKLIMRNSTVPARATEMFSTSVDGQTSVKLHVLQGERELVKDCRSLGEFHLRGLPPMPAGIPQVQVEFLVDANGILSVSAVERRSGVRAMIQVAPRYGLTREEVEAMERDAFVHARDDMRIHRVIDLAVNAALDVKWIAGALERVERLPAGDRSDLEGHLARVREFIEAARKDPGSVDAEAFHRAKEELDRRSVPLHEMAIAQSLREMNAGESR